MDGIQMGLAIEKKRAADWPLLRDKKLEAINRRAQTGGITKEEAELANRLNAERCAEYDLYDDRQH